MVIVLDTPSTPVTANEHDALIGFAVLTSDDERLGTVSAIVHPQATAHGVRGGYYFVVSPGMFQRLINGAEDIVIPSSLVRKVYPHDRSLVLDATRDDIARIAWPAPSDTE
jgi:hypothetical protein